MKILTSVLAASTLLLCVFAKCEKDDEGNLSLPTAVQQYIDANYQGYEAEEAENETLCDGKTVLEVEIEGPNDQEIDLTFDAEYNFLFSKQEIAVNQLPAAVSGSIAALYAGYNVKEAEKVTMANDSVRYEVEVKKAGTALDVLFDAGGEKICEVSGDDDDDDE